YPLEQPGQGTFVYRCRVIRRAIRAGTERPASQAEVGLIHAAAPPPRGASSFAPSFVIGCREGKSVRKGKASSAWSVYREEASYDFCLAYQAPLTRHRLAWEGGGSDQAAADSELVSSVAA